MGFGFITYDWRELLWRNDIHIIDICSPNSMHTDQLLGALAAGKRIYYDNPLALGEEDLSRVGAAVVGVRDPGRWLCNTAFPCHAAGKAAWPEGIHGECRGLPRGRLAFRECGPQLPSVLSQRFAT